jgi:PAS domain S-box-containing protein
MKPPARDPSQPAPDAPGRLAAEIGYRSVLAAMHDGVVLQAMSGAILDCNPAAERILGLSLEQMAGRTSLDPRWRCVHEDRTPFPGEEHPAMVTLRTGAPVRGVVMGVHRADGTLVWISINAEPLLRPGDGELLGAVTSFSDVTEPRRAEATLRSTERRLAMVLDHVSDGFFTIDRDWRYGYINQAGARMVGHTPQSLVGRKYLEAFPEASGTVWERTYRHVMETGEPATIEDCYEPLDQWFEASVFPNADGISAFFRDITERKRIERRLQQAQALAHVGSWEVELATKRSWWSDETFRVLGLEPGARESSYGAYLDAVHPDDRSLVDRSFQRSLEKGEPYDLEHRVLTAGGRLKHVRAQVRFALSSENGKPRRAEGTLQDVSALVQAEVRLRRILDSMSTIVVLYDLDGNLIEANRAALAMAGLSLQQVVGKPFIEAPWFAHSEDEKRKLRLVHARAAHGEIIREEVKVRLAGGSFADFDAMFGPLRDAGGIVVAVIGSGVDVTDRKKAEDAARRSADLVRAVVQGAPAVVFALDSQGVFKLSEGRGLEKMGLRPGQLVGVSALELYASVPGFAEAFRRTLSGEVAKLASRMGPIAFEAIYAPSYDADGNIDGVIGVGFDVTDRAVAEAGMRDREARLSVVFNHSNDAMLLLSVDADGELRVAAANRAFVNRLRRIGEIDEAVLLGLTFEELTLNIYRRPAEILAQYLESLRRVIEERAPSSFEHTMAFPGGPVTTEVTLVPVPDDAGACIYVLWISHDITAKKEADGRIRASLVEKETLLREIHHRVKNNLQIIGSLLHFQAKKVREPEARQAFDDLRQRIFAMTLVHERLYQARDIAHVDFGDYVRTLVAELGRSFETREGVRLDCLADEVRLPIELALPGGMIVSELVMNALKYAFPDRRAGTVRVTIRTADGRIVLGVDDDGVGFSSGFDPGTHGSFGWELIRMLALQLDGSVEAAGVSGVHVRVSFPAPGPAEVCG